MTKLAAGVVVVALAVLAAGCASADQVGGKPAGAAVAGFPEEAAAAVLAAFDQADSAASSAADPVGLKAQEVPPSLDASLAAANRAKHAKRTPPSFRHTQPGFAIPEGDPACFLVVASLQVSGAELALADVTQFLRQDGGGWKASHNVSVNQASAAQARTLARQPVLATGAALDEPRRDGLAAEVFRRTTGAGAADLSVLAGSNLALAENLIRRGQAACRYLWRMPPRRSCLRMSRRVICSGSVIGVGSERSGRAFAMPWCGRCRL
ncbi:hypothetical protein AB0H83_46790 [Dactylosporangium sp. NPDC050688]|uniref:hypothetical protein n=1 Tax=Dactylosporangium sp. NPDC050688 TaxID=3157217 RepID=UPI0033CDD392